ncbi:MAG TPA: glycosyltransferase family 4 protein [Gemmatimonadaceae bacterium]|nr:glycosyltransferase family 4 protein [Gemmatimonadaceae bacterium]
MLRYAIRRDILDHPNERSSHVRATPRGGGVGIVATVEGLLVVATLAGLMPLRLLAAVGGGGALVAAVGWIDDQRGLSARTRASIHFVAAVWAVTWLRGVPIVTLGAHVWHVGPLGAILAVIGIVWATNLFNFMDGIDGIAGSEAAVTGLAAAIMLSAVASDLAIAFILVAGASAGFLRWNWMPARIFMGDAGSGYLGFVLAVLALAAQNAEVLALPLSLVLYGVFVMDATTTLLRRVLAGERWYGAHRSHAYQRAVQAGASHAAVTTGVVVLNMALVACVVIAQRNAEAAVPALGVAIALVVVAYLVVERVRPMRPRRPATDTAIRADGEPPA